MAFFNSAVDVLQTLVVALGAGLGIWGAINLLEGYGNAALIEKAFYSGKDLTPGEKKEVPETDGAGEQQPALDPELLAKILANPEMAALLNALAKGLK